METRSSCRVCDGNANRSNGDPTEPDEQAYPIVLVTTYDPSHSSDVHEGFLRRMSSTCCVTKLPSSSAKSCFISSNVLSLSLTKLMECTRISLKSSNSPCVRLYASGGIGNRAEPLASLQHFSLIHEFVQVPVFSALGSMSRVPLNNRLEKDGVEN